MSSQVNLVGIVGSLRAESLNRAIFNTVVEIAPPGVTITEAPLADVPLYNADVEAKGDPTAVGALKQAVSSSDGVIVFTPEYNRSMPAVTKNAIDWLSRMGGDDGFKSVNTALVGATIGGHEVAGVRDHLGHVLGLISRFTEPSLGIGSIGDKVENGRITDEATLADLKDWLDQFVQQLAP